MFQSKEIIHVQTVDLHFVAVVVVVLHFVVVVLHFVAVVVVLHFVVVVVLKLGMTIYQLAKMSYIIHFERVLCVVCV